MGKVLELGICKNPAEPVIALNEITVIPGEGVQNDRHCRKHNDDRTQITLIESEKIDLYNNSSKTSIPYLSFRRNIVTKDISLNELVGKEILVGKIRLKVNDLCQPCLHLQQILNQKDFAKKMRHQTGIRCEIINDGKISKGDEIKVIS